MRQLTMTSGLAKANYWVNGQMWAFTRGEPTEVPDAVYDALVERPEFDHPLDGSVDDILAWVDGDPQRAMSAHHRESGNDRPRASLIKSLEKILNEGTPS